MKDPLRTPRLTKFLLEKAPFALISGQPEGGGGDPGDIRGNSAGFAGFCCKYLALDGGIGPLLPFPGKIHGGRPAGFVTSPPSSK